jgi:hypothetical protein
MEKGLESVERMRRKSERKEIEMMVICSMLWNMLYILDLENAVMFVYLSIWKMLYILQRTSNKRSQMCTGNHARHMMISAPLL